MKILLKTSVAILFLAIITFNLQAQYTRQQAIDKVLNDLIGPDTTDVNVYAANNLMGANDNLNQ